MSRVRKNLNNIKAKHHSILQVQRIPINVKRENIENKGLFQNHTCRLFLDTLFSPLAHTKKQLASLSGVELGLISRGSL